MKHTYQYFVEGETEERIISVLKTDIRCIQPGKVKVLNVVTRRLTTPQVATLNHSTILILVFDTDTNDASILKENIAFLKRQSMIKQVVCIPQVRNLEEELVRSCNITHIKDLLSSRSNTDFKHDIGKCGNLVGALYRHAFSIQTFWSASPAGPFFDIPNESAAIRIN